MTEIQGFLFLGILIGYVGRDIVYPILMLLAESLSMLIKGVAARLAGLGLAAKHYEEILHSVKEENQK